MKRRAVRASAQASQRNDDGIEEAVVPLLFPEQQQQQEEEQQHLQSGHPQLGALRGVRLSHEQACVAFNVCVCSVQAWHCNAFC